MNSNLKDIGLFGSLAILCVLMAAFIVTPAHAFGEYDIGRDSRTRQETLYSGQVKAGTVVQVREVAVQSSQSAQTVSTGVGALLGGVLGSKAGNGNGRYVASALGAVLGGLAGNKVGDMVSSAKAQEIIVRKEDGGLIVITQADSDLRAGQAVFLVESYGKVRVIPAATGI